MRHTAWGARRGSHAVDGTHSEGGKAQGAPTAARVFHPVIRNGKVGNGWRGSNRKLKNRPHLIVPCALFTKDKHGSEKYLYIASTPKTNNSVICAHLLSHQDLPKAGLQPCVRDPNRAGSPGPIPTTRSTHPKPPLQPGCSTRGNALGLPGPAPSP